MAKDKEYARKGKGLCILSIIGGGISVYSVDEVLLKLILTAALIIAVVIILRIKTTRKDMVTP